MASDPLIDAHDIEVGRDAFLQDGRQILACVEFVHYHLDPFEWDLSLVKLADWRMLEYLVRWPCMPARLVRRVMSAYERGSANPSAWEWLTRVDADDDLEICGIALHELSGLSLRVDPEHSPPWSAAK